jgi:hypothetical protein
MKLAEGVEIVVVELMEFLPTKVNAKLGESATAADVVRVLVE